MKCLSSCKLLYCLSKSSKVGLQPTSWTGLPDNSGISNKMSLQSIMLSEISQRKTNTLMLSGVFRCVSLTRLLTQKTSSKPKTRKPFLCCKTELNSEGRWHLAGEIRGTVRGTNRPSSCLDVSQNSQYPQGAKKPQTKYLSGLNLLAGSPNLLLNQVLFCSIQHTARQNSETPKFAAKGGFIRKAAK